MHEGMSAEWQQEILGMQSASNLDHSMDKGEEARVEKAAAARRGTRESNQVLKDRMK